MYLTLVFKIVAIRLSAGKTKFANERSVLAVGMMCTYVPIYQAKVERFLTLSTRSDTHQSLATVRQAYYYTTVLMLLHMVVHM